MLREEWFSEFTKQNLVLAKRIRRENKIKGSDEFAYSFIIACLKIMFPRIGYKVIKKSIVDDYIVYCIKGTGSFNCHQN